MISLVKIDGVSYDALVTAVQEKYEVIEGANSGISLYRQREIRDMAGIKIGHSVTFAPDNDPEAFDALCNYLFSSLREFVVLEIVHGQTTISYEAAYNTGSRAVSHIDDDNDVVYWNELTVDFRPMECQIN
jgi:hypothetical protein